MERSLLTALSDALLAKVMVYDKDRPSAIDKALKVLSASKLQGPPTNLHFTHAVIQSQGELAN